jgi:hypothetical protein
MKRDVFVPARLALARAKLPRAHLPKVLRRPWRDVGEEFKRDASYGRPADGDVEEDDWIRRHLGAIVPIHDECDSG